VWRIGLSVAGAVLYFGVAPRLIVPGLRLFLGPDPSARPGRVRRLTLLPYLVGGATFVAAGLLNPHGLGLVLISAVAASFGGTSLLAWYPAVWLGRAPVEPAAAVGVQRSPGWIALGLLTLLLFVGVLGPGIRLAVPRDAAESRPGAAAASARPT